MGNVYGACTITKEFTSYAAGLGFLVNVEEDRNLVSLALHLERETNDVAVRRTLSLTDIPVDPRGDYTSNPGGNPKYQLDYRADIRVKPRSRIYCPVPERRQEQR